MFSGPTARIEVPDTEIDIGKIDCQLSSNNNYQNIPHLNLTNFDPHFVSQNGLNYWNHNIAPHDGNYLK